MQVSGQMRNVKIYYKVNARKVVQVSGQMNNVIISHKIKSTKAK